MLNKSQHFFAFIFYPVLAFILSFVLELNGFESIFFFLIIPSIHLSIIQKKYIQKAALFALVISTLLYIPIDYVAQLSKAWLIPETVFPFRLFNLVPIDAVLWTFLLVYFIVMFYEYFINTSRQEKVWTKRMTVFALFSAAIFLIFTLLFFVAQSYLEVPFFFLIFGVVFLLLPVLLEIIRNKKLSGNFFLIMLYFVGFAVLYELAALSLGWWSFPGEEFLGWVSISDFKFPLEELIFWFLLFAVGVVAIYEFCDDDEK